MMRPASLGVGSSSSAVLLSALFSQPTSPISGFADFAGAFDSSLTGGAVDCPTGAANDFAANPFQGDILVFAIGPRYEFPLLSQCRYRVSARTRFVEYSTRLLGGKFVARSRAPVSIRRCHRVVFVGGGARGARVAACFWRAFYASSEFRRLRRRRRCHESADRERSNNASPTTLARRIFMSCPRGLRWVARRQPPRASGANLAFWGAYGQSRPQSRRAARCR